VPPSGRDGDSIQRISFSQISLREGTASFGAWLPLFHAVQFNPEMNLMLIVPDNRKVIQRDLSDFPRLKGATMEQLNAYERGRTGVHWPALDEDLSLRGFLRHEMLNVLGGRREAA
jgi:hypothetical protein